MPGAGSQLDALARSNDEGTNLGLATIAFDPSLAGQPVALSTVGDVGIGWSRLFVTSSVTISGSGQTITRSGATEFRPSAVSVAGDLTLPGLTLTNGRARGGAGGSGGGAELAFGGGTPRVRLFDGKALLSAPAPGNVNDVAGAEGELLRRGRRAGGWGLPGAP